MTNEERKQFINEYCRNVAHKPMTKLCNTCEYLKFCARSSIEDVGCDRYKKDTTTNEEWLCSLSTEEKAKFLQSISVLSLESKDEDLEDWKRWLKEKHE